jgi:hypothetical protein
MEIRKINRKKQAQVNVSEKQTSIFRVLAGELWQRRHETSV